MEANIRAWDDKAFSDNMYRPDSIERVGEDQRTSAMERVSTRITGRVSGLFGSRDSRFVSCHSVQGHIASVLLALPDKAMSATKRQPRGQRTGYFKGAQPSFG